MDNITLILSYVVHAATPILFVALGELIVERSGVLNLGLEGMMMVGAFSGFYAGFSTGSVLAGFIVAACVTGVFALIHGVLTITLHANQTVCGLALTFLGTGLASFMGRSFINKSAPATKEVALPLLKDIPFLGDIFFRQNVIVYLSYFAIVAISVFLYKTRPGLRLQFCGDSPATADTAGVNISKMRYLSVFFGGVMAGIGGAFLTLADSSPWSDQISNGRGWIAVAIVIFGRWNPYGVAAGSYIFGALNSLQFKLQARSIDLSAYILGMIPYLFTIVILSITSIRSISRKFGTPEALGEPYIRENKE